jgi:phasin family protein
MSVPISLRSILTEQKSIVVAAFDISDVATAFVEKIMNLNTSLASSILSETNDGALRMSSPNTPAEWFIALGHTPLTMSEKSFGYARKSYEIVSSAHAGLIGIARARCETFGQLFPNDTSNDTSSLEPGPIAWKRTLDAATGFYDALNKAGMQMVQIAVSNLDFATSNVGKLATEATASRAKR